MTLICIFKHMILIHLLDKSICHGVRHLLCLKVQLYDKFAIVSNCIVHKVKKIFIKVQVALCTWFPMLKSV